LIEGKTVLETHMKTWAKALSALLILGAVTTVHAQQGPGGGGPGGGQDNGGPGGGGPGGGGGGFGGGGPGGPPDPAEMRARMDERLKTALGTTDDAWATLQPLLDKVQELEHETDTGPLQHGRPHRPDDDGNDQQDQPAQSPIEVSIAALKKVLSDKASTDPQIETAMKAVEDAEKKTKDDLADAQKQLKAATSMRQQAVLVAVGILN
jgi:hypothetical protein